MMGIVPSVFYEMEFDDFWLYRNGWIDKLDREESIYRKMTMIIASAMVGGKNVKPDQLWPTRGEGKKVKMITYKGMRMTESQMRRLKNPKKLTGVNIPKRKNG